MDNSPNIQEETRPTPPPGYTLEDWEAETGMVTLIRSRFSDKDKEQVPTRESLTTLAEQTIYAATLAGVAGAGVVLFWMHWRVILLGFLLFILAYTFLAGLVGALRNIGAYEAEKQDPEPGWVGAVKQEHGQERSLYIAKNVPDETIGEYDVLSLDEQDARIAKIEEEEKQRRARLNARLRAARVDPDSLELEINNNPEE